MWGGSDIDIRRYLWEYLFQKSCVDGAENLCVSNNDRKKTISIEFIRNLRKQRNNLMLGLALNGLGSAYSLVPL